MIRSSRRLAVCLLVVTAGLAVPLAADGRGLADEVPPLTLAADAEEAQFGEDGVEGEPLLLAQVVNPADAAAGRAAEQRERAGDPADVAPPEPPPRRAGDAATAYEPTSLDPRVADDARPPRLRSYELPPVDVVGDRPLREEDRIGSYGQPRWTATRRFPGTRVYVVPEGKVELEYWLRPTFTEDGETELRTLYEIEIGLPHRFQLDLYLRTDQDGDDEEILLGSQFEIRYALADWGVIPGNPTLYAEWVGLERWPDKVELKLLLGDELAPRWHWGVNAVAELETGGEREYEYQLTGGLSYTVIDERFSVGAEGMAIFADVKGDRGDFSQTYYVGPSFQYRPAPQFTINFAPLVGIGPDAGDARLFLNLGYEF